MRMIEIAGVVVKSEECLQGLKPRFLSRLMSEPFTSFRVNWKLRPPKENVGWGGAALAAENSGVKTPGEAQWFIARLKPRASTLSTASTKMRAAERASFAAERSAARFGVSFFLAGLLALAIVVAPAVLRAQDAPQAAQQESQQLAPNATPQDETPAVQLTPAQTARATSLGKRVKCMCGGCDDAAGMCTHSGGAFAGPCDTAKAELKEIDARVARGDSDDLILQSFVQEYGPTVLIEPPKSGFNWLAWIMPVVFPLVALLLVWQVVRKWHRRAALAPASGPPLSMELMERARREADKESDE
jgi:cytochrome c-type biogenesis protein CcmH